MQFVSSHVIIIYVTGILASRNGYKNLENISRKDISDAIMTFEGNNCLQLKKYVDDYNEFGNIKIRFHYFTVSITGNDSHTNIMFSLLHPAKKNEFDYVISIYCQFMGIQKQQYENDKTICQIII